MRISDWSSDVCSSDLLAANYQFWQHTKDGLAVFATRDSFDVYRLPRSVQPLAVVADTAHTKPLLKYLQTKDRYHLLVLTTNTAQLYEGDRYQLDEADLSQADVDRKSTRLNSSH